MPSTQEVKETAKTTQHFTSGGESFSNPLPNSDLGEATAQALENTETENEAPEAEMTYSERLKELKITDEKAYKIIDDICEKGSYLEDYTIRKERDGKKKVKVVFSTRDSRTQGYIIERVSAMHNNSPLVYNKLIGELQMAASIVFYNGETFSALSDIEDTEQFEEEVLRRVQTFAKLPAPIVVVMGRSLSKFDLEVASVMAPGYEDFF